MAGLAKSGAVSLHSSKPSPVVAGRPLRVSKGGGGRRPPGDMKRKGLTATAGPIRSLRIQDTHTKKHAGFRRHVRGRELCGNNQRVTSTLPRIRPE